MVTKNQKSCSTDHGMFNDHWYAIGNKAAMIKATTAADGNIYSLAIFEPATWNMTPYRLYINEVWLNLCYEL